MQVGEGDLAAAKKKDLFLPLKCKKKVMWRRVGLVGSPVQQHVAGG